ncbi:uncharacterized protein LOC130164709 isoform X2 [Seriola aureovittata]|uniref:uncharacterized protein LOC130164709 isoform X2 n=1 Tax=Seriola aureovittata TaxID=2871759 RepID=UPI0024BE2020|nr:uncharacterized protein LOC130164709 isoform X2 [Seriola aureovittata]
MKRSHDYNDKQTADIKYHGLMNQGATCYLNSVLQVLFMTKGFREAVERYTSGNPDTKRVDYQLKGLFDDLKKRTAYTYNITQKLGIHRVYEQRDAAEFFDNTLTLTSPEASQIFCGKLTHETRCSECGTITDTNGPSWHLPLALGDSRRYSVVHGIQEFFKESHISGENQLFCDHCDAKADATVKCVIKHHPEVLMLLLKRFEFNYRYMTYVKNNCDVDVPRTLQIPENQTYELYAVVDHFGDLRGGHYTATVKSEDDDRWYNFNDSRVSLLHHRQLQVDNSEKSRSVYLLFYRKKKTHTADTCTQDIKEVPTSGGLVPAAADNHDQSHDAGKIREGEESGETVEVGNDTAEDVSNDRNGETGIRDTDSVVSGGVELSHDNICNVHQQDSGADVNQIISQSHPGWEEGGSGSDQGPEQQREESVETVEVGNDTAEDVSNDRNLETGIRETVSVVVSGGVELSHDNIRDVEDQDNGADVNQSISQSHQGWEEGGSGSDQGHEQQREESVERVEVDNDTAEDVSNDRNGETGIRDKVSVVSGGVELSHDNICKEEDQDSGADVNQSISQSHQGWEEGGSGSDQGHEQQREESVERVEVGNDTAEDVSNDRNGETGIRDTDSVVSGGVELSHDNICKEEDQDSGADVNQSISQSHQGWEEGGSGSDQGHEQQREESVERVEVGNDTAEDVSNDRNLETGIRETVSVVVSGGVELSHDNICKEEDQDNGADFNQSISQSHQGWEEGGSGSDQGHEQQREESVERVEVGNDTAEDVSNDRNGETGIRDKVSLVSGGVELSHDNICKEEDQDSGADVNQSISQSHQGWEEGGSGSDQGHEQQREESVERVEVGIDTAEERGDAEGDKKQKREAAQRKETSTTKPSLTEGVGDQGERGYKDVGVKEQAKKQENDVDEQIPNSATKRAASSAGRERLAENPEIIETLEESKRKSDPKTDVLDTLLNDVDNSPIKKKKKKTKNKLPCCLRPNTKE